MDDPFEEFVYQTARHPTMKLVAIVGVLVALFCCTTAYRQYLRMLPNSASVPCVNPADCISSNGICGGFGHDDCLNGDENNFANDYPNLWTEAFCRMDVDGDGKTNGDELGDPCCRWNRGSPPDRTTGISHPAESASVTAFPSCMMDGPPIAVSSMVVEETGATRLKISWPKQTSSCVCGYNVSVTVTPGGTVVSSVAVPNRFERPDVLSNQAHYAYYIEGLEANTGYAIQVTPFNLAGTSSGPQRSVVTSASLTPVDSQTLPVQDLVVGKAGEVGDLSSIHSALGPFYGFLALLIACGWMIGVRLRDPHSVVRYWAIHRSIIGPPTSRIRRLCTQWLHEMTWATCLAVSGAVLSLLGVFFLSHSRNEYNVYPFDESGLAWRSFGHSAAAAMALTLYPVTRYSLWVSVVGLSFERALVYHRWLGIWTIVLVVIHGVAMWFVYADSTIGTSQFWSTGYDYNVLTGFLAAVFMALMAVFALEWVRRRKYGWFYAVHWTLSMVVVVLVVIHYPVSAFYLGIPAALYFLDLAVIAFRGFWTPTSLVSVRTFDERDGDSSSPDIHHILELQLQNRFIQAVKGGQYVYLFIPKLSFMAHPFSVVHTAAQKKTSKTSVDTAGGVPFRVCIKPMSNSESSWTKRLFKLAYGCEKSEIPRIYAFGPFGVPSVHMESMEHVVLFAGGIGVTPMTTICADVLRSGNCKRVHFVFIFRALSVLKCIAGELKELAATENVEVVMSLCHTSAKHPRTKMGSDATAVSLEPIAAAPRTMGNPLKCFAEPEVLEDSDTADDLSDIDMSTEFTLQSARPDIHAILSAEAQKAHSCGCKAVGVAVCGPQRLRDAVAKYGRVSLSGVRFLVHSETFEM